MWVAMAIKKEAYVEVLGQEVELPISDLADGCVGCLLVFDTEESVANYLPNGQALKIEGV